MDYGKVIRFDTERGFGFIAPDRGGPDLFVHVSALERGSDARQLAPGVPVTYEEAAGPRGTKAVRVRVVQSRPEDAWPEYADQGAAVASPFTEEAFNALCDQLRDELIARMRERGWL